MKPVCVKCHRFYRVKKNGFYFIEGMPATNTTEPGLSDPNGWRPYKVWNGDLWECQGCGSQIISGVGFSSVIEQHHPNFQATVEHCNADQFQVNDC